jgi:hypothetical protein
MATILKNKKNYRKHKGTEIRNPPSNMNWRSSASRDSGELLEKKPLATV